MTGGRGAGLAQPGGVDLTQADTHFAFGENWASYSATIDEAVIAEAVKGLTKLVPQAGWQGATVLDIGSGSGLHALAALRCGAARVLATDIDSDAVATTGATLRRHAPDADWDLREVSVFDLDPLELGTFDVVYAWGVLHHTGDLWRALSHTAALVRPGGWLVVAIYLRTPFCGFWTWEKARYARAPAMVQRIVRTIYKAAFIAAFARNGRNPLRYIRRYHSSNRGMSWHHDVHDWLGGYPYESAAPEAVLDAMRREGLEVERVVNARAGSGPAR